MLLSGCICLCIAEQYANGMIISQQGHGDTKEAVSRAEAFLEVAFVPKHKLHTDQDLFDKAYGYIRQYY